MKKHYSSLKTTKSLVECEGVFCESQTVNQVKAKVVVDPWITIDNDVEFN